MKRVVISFEGLPGYPGICDLHDMFGQILAP